MKNLFIFSMVLFVFFSSTDAVTVPTVYSFVIDASASVSKSDFQRANQAVAGYLEYIYARAKQNPGANADFVTVKWFGGDNEYYSTPFYNGSNVYDMANLQAQLLKSTHPSFSYTSIYTAIARSSAESVQHQISYDINYLHFVILITDGEDTGSSTKMREVVRNVFPSDDITLIVIGVGPGAKVSQFKKYATTVTHISSFGELAATLEEIKAYYENLLQLFVEYYYSNQ